MPDSYRTRVRGLLELRLNRLFAMLASDAPDSLVSAELALIGEVGPMLDPHGYGRRAGEEAERKARRAIGMCEVPSCPADPGDDDGFRELCDEHAEAMRVVAAEAAATTEVPT